MKKSLLSMAIILMSGSFAAATDAVMSFDYFDKLDGNKAKTYIQCVVTSDSEITITSISNGLGLETSTNDARIEYIESISSREGINVLPSNLAQNAKEQMVIRIGDVAVYQEFIGTSEARSFQKTMNKRAAIAAAVVYEKCTSLAKSTRFQNFLKFKR